MEKLESIQTLIALQSYEKALRSGAFFLIAVNDKFIVHLETVQQTMDLADTLRQIPTDDEDLKVIQLLGMRVFNAFASGLLLATCGYSQNSALVMRDILETVFLVDMFQTDRQLITEWRTASDTKRRKKFGPIHVREFLDARDGFVGMKRAQHYRVFSELAGHPTMKSSYMMRPQKNGSAYSGPFISAHLLEIVITEMGSLAFQASQQLDKFFPEDFEKTKSLRQQFRGVREKWFKTFVATANTV